MKKLTLLLLLLSLTSAFAVPDRPVSIHPTTRKVSPNYFTHGLPITDKAVAYTTVLADANSALRHPSTDNNARTFTIDSNANVAYDVGTQLEFINEINTLSIAITSDTLTLLGLNTTGTVSLPAASRAVAIKVTSTKWNIVRYGTTPSSGADGLVLTGKGASTEPAYEYAIKLVKSGTAPNYTPLTVATTAAPASPLDIGTITIPAGITRWRLAGTAGTSSFHGLYPETIAGTMAAATFQVWTGAGGTGTQMISNLLGPAVQQFAAAGAPATLVGTTNTLYVRQIADSNNAATITFYLAIQPLP